jgi:hypothetical protein
MQDISLMGFVRRILGDASISNLIFSFGFRYLLCLISELSSIKTTLSIDDFSFYITVFSTV